MATLLDFPCATSDVGKCSICYDNFKAPRYLPCKHSFCHDCLYTYIASHCTSTDSHLGFHCPICRVYIPNTRDTDNPEDWTKCFPENFVLQKYENSSCQRLCEACFRESEEEDATHFCFNCNEKMCKNCTKYHSRGQLTRSHQVSILSEITCKDLVPYQINGEFCAHHQGLPITLFCQDHEEPCCAPCASTSHRKCQRVASIEETATSTRTYFEEECFDWFVEDLEIIQNKLLNAKYDQEKIVAEMKNRADTISEETERAFDEAIKHLQFLKNQFLTNMTINVKKNGATFVKNINTLLDGIQCARYCEKSIEESIGLENDTKLAVTYHEAKKCFNRLKRYNFSLMHVKIKEKNHDILEKIMKLTSLSDVIFLETATNVKSCLEQMRLRFMSEYVLEEGFIRDGAFISCGEFMVSILKYNPKCYFKGQCLNFDKCGKYLQAKRFISEPFRILFDRWNIIIVFPSKQYMQLFSSFSSLSVGSKPKKLLEESYCITRLYEHLYVACGNKIIKINYYGNRYATFDTGPSVKYITSTSSNIIYSNRRTNEVVAMDGRGTTVWRYSSPRLLSPCGLSVDGEDNIYVAGKESDNIQVLTKDGQFVRVFEDITRPDFMKVDKERKLCFVGSMRKYLRVYEML